VTVFETIARIYYQETKMNDTNSREMEPREKSSALETPTEAGTAQQALMGGGADYTRSLSENWSIEESISVFGKLAPGS
jgi:hypothetical protein